MAFVLLLAALAVGCSADAAAEREAAVQRVLALDPRLERAQAECYVDRVTDELGRDVLPPGSAPPEAVTRLTSIRIDCIGVANLGTPAPPPPVAADGTVPGPQAPGDDPGLDALYEACGAGSGLACDRLFDAAPVGSAYEEFASTCGERTKELTCAEVYPDPPGVSAPPAPTTPR